MVNGIRYFSTVVHSSGLPRSFLPEIPLIGRSNSGKSTLINSLSGQTRLAYTSKEPGCTRTLNFFEVENKGFLVDLPGYGFARVARSEKHLWSGFIEEYLLTRECLRGVLLLIDIRRGLTPFDEQFLQWFSQTARPVYIVFSKADKLSKGQCGLCQRNVFSRLDTLGLGALCSEGICVSSLKKTGVNELSRVIVHWLS